MIAELAHKMKQNQFLFEELVKRDFKQKYKRTLLGMAWSILYPLITLLILDIIFSNYFGTDIAHYPIYLFCGQLVFSYFNESTNGGMYSLLGNAHIFSKVNVPKYLFLLSKNVSSFINFCLTLCIFFVFVFFNDVPFTWKFIFLLFPIACLVVFNIGMGLIISALLVFFRDMSYLYSVFTMLLMYMSAIFYSVEIVPAHFRFFFYLNPVYIYIKYLRLIVLNGEIPSLGYHLLCLGYALIAVLLGGYIYKKYNHMFLYYI